MAHNDSNTPDAPMADRDWDHCDWYKDGDLYVCVITGMPEQAVRIGIGETAAEAYDGVEGTPMQSTGPDGGLESTLAWAANQGWLTGELDPIETPVAPIRTELTKRELAEAIASELLDLHERDLDRAVGLDQDGDVANCYEGGRRLAAVLVTQSSDVDSYGGGEMGPKDVAAIADAFEGMWLDDYNARVHGTDEPEIEWAEESQANHGNVYDYASGDILRPATAEEGRASIEAAKHDGGSGVIKVDGRSCYVQ